MAAASDEVKFLGGIYEPELVQALRFHSLGYLHGHTVGGTNPSLVEAMGAGNPVIAHDNEYNRWVAQDAALYFTSAEDVDASVTALTSEPALAERLGSAARTPARGGVHLGACRRPVRAAAARDAREIATARRIGAWADRRRQPVADRARNGAHVIRVGVVGLGKMGLSHLSMFNAHPDVEVAGVCDSTGYLLSMSGQVHRPDDVLRHGVHARRGEPRCRGHRHADRCMHASMVRTALERGLHVFCEKPFCLDPADSDDADRAGREQGTGHPGRLPLPLRRRLRGGQAAARRSARSAGHPRAGRGVRAGRAEAAGRTWRSKKNEGGGASTTTPPTRSTCSTGISVSRYASAGTVLNQVFSRETDDEVFGTLFFADGATAQLSVNWCDESQRKMTTKITDLGDSRPDLRRPPGDPGLPARRRGLRRTATRPGGT